MKRVVWSEFGALTSAGTVAATIFCCLPFATGVIGAGIAAFGARLAPFQPYLMGTSIVLLTYSFYGAYRPDASCAGDHCEAPGILRVRRVMVWCVAALVALLLTASWWADRLIYWTL